MPLSPIPRGLARAGQSVAQHLFLNRQVRFWRNELLPGRALGPTPAVIVAVIDETPDTKTFVLRPHTSWSGHRAGQFVTVTVEVDGVRTSRCYSLSSAPNAPLLAITVKRVPGGRMSAWLHDAMGPGDRLGLSDPAGDFALPTSAPTGLLLLSGGSGITPVMSILRDLAARDAVDDVVFLHHARSRADIIFHAELERLAAQHPSLRLVFCLDDDPDTPRGFHEATFARLVPDYAQRHTYLCGPGAMMQRVEDLYACAGLSHRLDLERFVSPAVAMPTDVSPEGVRIRLTNTGATVTAQGPGSLLDQLERAGERPRHGCRMGICHTCTCTKRSGAVQNLLTGEVSTEPDQLIQLCISVPRSDLDLELS